MWDLFFDKEGVFQWASIAAAVSLLAFFASLLSIILNHKQGKKNRQSSTLVQLQIEDLKDLRVEAISAISLIRKYTKDRHLGENPFQENDIKNISESDPILGDLDAHMTMLVSKLYRQSLQANKLTMAVSSIQLKMMSAKNTRDLATIQIELQNAIDEYSRVEYKAIEKSI